MIPSVVGFEVQEALRDFLATEFRPSNAQLSDLIDQFLADETNLLKGPYLSLSLPYLHSAASGEPFPETPLGFRPYKHQRDAFDRLSSGRSTIVATGTGSGKTEAFLYPILDWCRRQSGKPGIKAILIYPMNALANDQAGRIARVVHRTQSLRGKVIAGLYVGQDAHSQHGQVMTPTRVISNRETLLQRPPDILLTNYKMLDYLLSRPKDQRLWRKNEPGTLRWLVVDELHTFDGAQGTDLACLIRRLKSRLRVEPDSLVCVGTSATLGASATDSASSTPIASAPPSMAAEQDAGLIEYADQVFGTTFGAGSIIREQRLSAHEFLGNVLLSHHLMPQGDLAKLADLSSFASSEEYIRAQYQLFFGEDPGPGFYTDDWRLALADRLRSHSAFVNLLRTAGERPRSLNAIVSEFRRSAPWCSERDLAVILRGLCALISVARTRDDEHPEARLRPFLQVSLHLWVRELGRMVSSLWEDPPKDAGPDSEQDSTESALPENRKPSRNESSDPQASRTEALPDTGSSAAEPYRRLRHSDDLGPGEPAVYLPLIQCFQCRVTGWGAVLNSANDRLQQDLRIFYNHFFDRDVAARFLFPEDPPLNSSAPLCSVCGACGHFRLGPAQQRCPECSAERCVEVCMPDLTKEKQSGTGTDRRTRVQRSTDCPYCGSPESLFILGARSSVLLGVLLSQAYATRHNDDRKVLAFSDNVQDAAHRAGFLSHRTWRNSKRAAIAQAVSGGPGVSLRDLPDRVVSKWGDPQASDSAFPIERFVGEFIAPDRAWMKPVEGFRRTGQINPKSNLPKLVKERLQWEALAEFGFASSITRSLERTRTAAAGPEITRLKAAQAAARLRIGEEVEQLARIDEQSVGWIALGVLRRMKDSGAIWSENVDGIRRFRAGKFNRWVLTRNLALPEYGPGTPAPLFPCEGEVIAKSDGLEQLYRPGSGSPYQRWVAKVLRSAHALLTSDLTSAVLRIVLDCLKSNGLVRCDLAGGTAVWAIEPATYFATTDVRVLHASTSKRTLVVPLQEAPLWVGAPCLELGVDDRYGRSEASHPTWSGRMYRDAEIHRVVAEDHTALLSREKREFLERRFAADHSRPGDPNALSATPTLELGIDIGNLSTVALCSVPPTQANYVQRIGRAGRRDGNALTVTLASAAPHDLFFYAEPQEMLGGSIDPPGVFLDASAVLERQLTSFCLDNWAAGCGDPDAVPGKVRALLDNVEADGEQGFPYPFFTYAAKNAEGLFERFEQAFSDSLGEDSRKYLRVFLMGEQDKVPELRLRILDRLCQVISERRSLRRDIDRLGKSAAKLRNGPQDDATNEDLKQCLRERKGFQRLLREINGRDTFAFLTDEGLIPNYAFPEQGVTLRSLILRRPLGQEVQQATPGDSSTEAEHEAYEYIRPSVAALSELAPGNQFYAEGHKVEIDRVDIDLSPIEEWRLCPSCTHCRRIDDSAEYTACPRCGDPMWSDSGQARKMLPLRLVHATTAVKRAQIMDDRDDRESVFFTRHLVADFDPTAERSGYAVPGSSLPFAFEYASRTTFREMNFGQRTARGQPTKFAGDEIPREGFKICRFCGRVQPRGKNAPVEHTHGCRMGFRRAYTAIPGSFGPDDGVGPSSSDDAIVNCLYLYREFESESLRMLVPIIEEQTAGPRTQSFIAAVELGLRKKYRGKIDHVRVMTSFSPSPGQGFRRDYLVLYDSVPGGTGYLKELAKTPDEITAVLAVAQRHLAGCGCEDGCYRCLFAYRRRREMQQTSKRLALELLEQILAVADQLKAAPSIDDVSMEGLLESNLEARFVAALKERAQADRGLRIRPDIIRGKSGYVVTVGEETWYVEPQANLGPNDGVSQSSRPDFLCSPAKPSANKRPVAVFLDGFKYHKDSTGEDSVTRMALIRGGYLQWSLTWHDLEVAFGGTADAIDLLRALPARGGDTNPMAQVQEQLDAKWTVGPLRARFRLPSLELLLCYLREPDVERWKQAVFCEVFRIFDRDTMNQSQFQQGFHESLETTLPSQAVEEEAGLAGSVFVAGRGQGFETGLRYCDVFAAISSSAITNAIPDECFVAVHLHDQEPGDKDYRVEWNGALRLFNLIQFLPHSWWTTARAVHQGNFPEFSADADVSQAIDAEWSQVLELADDSLHGLLHGLARLGAPVPTVGYELAGAGGEVVGEAEIAWPDNRLAFLVDSIQPFAAEFQEAGWQLCDSGDLAESVASMLGKPTDGGN